MAIYQNEAAIVCQDTEQKMILFIEAVTSISKVEPLSNDNLAYLAQFQINIAISSQDKQQQMTWFKAAIISILKIKPFTNDNWRFLSNYQDKVGRLCQDKEEQLKWYKDAVISISNVKPFTDREWYYLAILQNNIGIKCQDEQQALIWHEKAIKSILNIDQFIDRTWNLLAAFQINAGMSCAEIGQLKQAQTYYSSSIDSQIKSNKKDYQNISDNYTCLCNLHSDAIQDVGFYSLAIDIFSNQATYNVRRKFLKLHLTISNLSFFSQPNMFNHLFLQLIQLIESSVNDPGFNNVDVKNWLSDPNDKQQFTQILEETKLACKPSLTLLNALGTAPTIWIAVADRLQTLTSSLQEAKREIRVIKRDNNELKTDMLSKYNAYQHNLTLFKDIPAKDTHDVRANITTDIHTICDNQP